METEPLATGRLGALFLDEMFEFPRSVLEALSQPMEDGHVTIARVAASLRFRRGSRMAPGVVSTGPAMRDIG